MTHFQKCTFLLLLLLMTFSVKAQFAQNKTKYSTKLYSYSQIDKYHPVVAGIASFVIPGLGQIYCNENKRGFKFMAGYGGAILLIITGGVIQEYNNLTSLTKSTTGTTIFTVAAITANGIQIWSCIDAIRVSKINNLALRDKKAIGQLFYLNPCIMTAINNSTIKLGLSAKLTF